MTVTTQKTHFAKDRPSWTTMTRQATSSALVRTIHGTFMGKGRAWFGHLVVNTGAIWKASTYT